MNRRVSLLSFLMVMTLLLVIGGSALSPASANPPLQATPTKTIEIGPKNPTQTPEPVVPNPTPPPGGSDIGGTPVKEPTTIDPPESLEELLSQFPDLQPYLDKVKDLTSDKLDLSELYAKVIQIFKSKGATGVAAFLKDSGLLDKLNLPLSYLDLLTVYDQGGLEAVAALARQRKLINEQDEIVGYLTIDSKDSLEAVTKDLEALGVSVYGFLPETDEVEIGIPLETLAQFQTPGTLLGYLIKVSSVAHVVGFRGPTGTQQTSPVKQATFQSIGAQTIGADKWHAAGITGKGVRIGILDMGFGGIKSAIGSFLPDTIKSNVKLEILEEQGNNHGTACAAVVHGIAPEAELFIAYFDPSSSKSFDNALTYLAKNKVQVVNYSAGNLIGPRDGTSLQAQKATDFMRKTGALWVNSAGNYAESHAAFKFKAGAKGVHFFDSKTNAMPFQAASTQTVVAMNWNGNWKGGEKTEYIFAILDQEGNEMVVAAEPRRGKKNEYPFQIAAFESEPGAIYYMVVQRTKGTTNNTIDIIIPNAMLPKWAQVPEYTVTTPADADAVLSVGATGLTSDELESYSSRGPTFDDRMKPDLSAPTGEKVSGYEDEGFFGTSGAAPAVAGAAGLVLEKFPEMSNAELKAYLIANVAVVGTAPDSNFGAGRLALPDPEGVDPEKPDPKKEVGTEPKATITDLKTKFNVNVGGVKGMAITVSFELENYKGKKLAVAALFLDDTGQPIPAASDEFSLGGTLATGLLVDVKRNQSIFKNVPLFIPNEEFANLPETATSIQFIVGILDMTNPKEPTRLVVTEPVVLEIRR